jgi:predicted outer membrane protein
MTSSPTPNFTPESLKEAEQTVQPLRDLLAAGFDPSGIRQQAEKHLAALQALPDGTELKLEAIEVTRRFIANLA